jgi:hypothetical protein
MLLPAVMQFTFCGSAGVSTNATPVLPLLHIAVLVTSCVEPSLWVPVAVKATPEPLACIGFVGDTLIETSAACGGPLAPVRVQAPETLDCAQAAEAVNKIGMRNFMV